MASTPSSTTNSLLSYFNKFRQSPECRPNYATQAITEVKPSELVELPYGG
ncbi:MAG TPA: hypothetical protein V6D04_01360 [Candidatus Obscuribacterales bacterium]